MKTSARGIADLIFSEGERLKTYRDSKGIPTIGVGHTASAGGLKPTPGLTITHQQEMDLLAADLKKFEARVSKRLGDVPQNVFDGAVSFDFNTGSIDSASWCAAYLRGDKADARKRFMMWDKPPEIIGRRTREAKLIFDGVYHSPAVLPAKGATAPDATVSTPEPSPIASGATPHAQPAAVSTAAIGMGSVVAHSAGLPWGWVAVVAVAVAVVGVILYATLRKGK